MKPPSTFDTSRLHLRLPVATDADTIFARYTQDKEVSKYMTWLPHSSIEDTREFLRCCILAWENESRFSWVICLHENDSLLGMVTLDMESFKTYLGYVIARPDWGKGYATEAAQVVVHWAIEQPSIYRVWAVCDVENPSSARVLEKVGMDKEGILRRFLVHPTISEVPRDVWCYSIIRS